MNREDAERRLAEEIRRVFGFTPRYKLTAFFLTHGKAGLWGLPCVLLTDAEKLLLSRERDPLLTADQDAIARKLIDDRQ